MNALWVENFFVGVCLSVGKESYLLIGNELKGSCIRDIQLLELLKQKERRKYVTPKKERERVRERDGGERG